jgi:hypothetical protein
MQRGCKIQIAIFTLPEINHIFYHFQQMDIWPEENLLLILMEQTTAVIMKVN